MIIEIDIQQIDVPRYLGLVEHILFNDLPSDRQRGRLRNSVDIFVVCLEQLSILLREQSSEGSRRKYVSGFRTGFDVVFGQCCLLVNPFPEDTEADFAGGCVFHQVKYVVIAEKDGGFQRCRLKALAKGQDLQALKAEDIMTSHPVTVEETATADMVINQMIEHQIIRIPVVRDDRLVGMISRTDLMNQLIDSHLINVYGG